MRILITAFSGTMADKLLMHLCDRLPHEDFAFLRLPTAREESVHGLCRAIVREKGRLRYIVSRSDPCRDVCQSAGRMVPDGFPGCQMDALCRRVRTARLSLAKRRDHARQSSLCRGTAVPARRSGIPLSDAAVPCPDGGGWHGSRRIRGKAGTGAHTVLVRGGNIGFFIVFPCRRFPDASYNRVLRPRGCFRLHLRGKDAIIKMFRSKKISQTTQPFPVFPHLSVNAPERMKKTL